MSGKTPKEDITRNFIIVVSSAEVWETYLQFNPDFKETLKEDKRLDVFTEFIPTDLRLESSNVVRRITFFNQRSIPSLQKKLRTITIYCDADPRDLRSKRTRVNDMKASEVRCCDCAKLLAHKTQSQSTAVSGNNSPARRQDLSEYEAIEKKVKLENNNTKIEYL